jgi:hypothetical protein
MLSSALSQRWQPLLLRFGYMEQQLHLKQGKALQQQQATLSPQQLLLCCLR